MNLDLLPDVLAMTALVSALILFRRNTPQRDVLQWIIALLLVLVESIARVFTPQATAHNGTWLHAAQLIAMEAYLGAGAVFLYAARSRRVPRRVAVRGGLLYIAGPAMLLAAFALGIRSLVTYEVSVGIGMAFSLLSWRVLRLSSSEGIVKILLWGPALYFVELRQFEGAAYWLLAYLFALIAAAFIRRLPADSTGRLAVVFGFLVWSASFMVHPWIATHPRWAGIAAQILNMEKFIVTIGMLMVLFERQIAENRRMALHDRLTGLPNTRLFEDRLENALARCRRSGTRCAMYLIDLNYFKQINDTLGHRAGDELLQQVARNLKHALRESDTVARIGGDEFVALAGDLGSFQGAQRVQQTLRLALAKPVILQGRSVSITGSVGMAIFPDDADNGETLRNCADQRMYAEKQKTRGETPPETPPEVPAEIQSSLTLVRNSKPIPFRTAGSR